jgi:hypothetical protein
MSGAVGYNGEDYFVAASFRYTNSFTPIASMGVLAEESSIMITFGFRFNAIEDGLPGTWKEFLHKK